MPDRQLKTRRATAAGARDRIRALHGTGRHFRERGTRSGSATQVANGIDSFSAAGAQCALTLVVVSAPAEVLDVWQKVVGHELPTAKRTEFLARMECGLIAMFPRNAIEAAADRVRDRQTGHLLVARQEDGTTVRWVSP